jgi:hypothetical protein
MSYTFNPFTGNLDVTPFSLDGAGKIPSDYLPSYVDDVVEYDDLAGFPGTGETGKIYVAKDTGYTYRWTGSVYVRIGSGGEVELNLGSAGSPSLFFNGDANTGIYSPGADQVAISTNGTGRLFVDSSGRVGVGTSNQLYPLSIQSDTSAQSISIFGRAADDISEIAFFESDRTTKLGELQYRQDHLNLRHRVGYISFSTGGVSERLRITSDGKVGLGTSAPDALLTISSSNSASVSNSRLRLIDTDTTAVVDQYLGRIEFFGSDATGAGAGVKSAITAKAQTTGGDSYLTFSTSSGGANDIERLRIDSSGRLLIGSTSSRLTGYGDNGSLQLEGTSYPNAAIVSILNSNDSTGPSINFTKTRGTSSGSNTIVQSGDNLGILNFSGGDGTDIRSHGARILCQVDGTPGVNDMPGRLVFQTTSDGANGPTERLRIDSSGNVGIGTSSPGQQVATGTVLQVSGGENGSEPALVLGNYSNNTSGNRGRVDFVGVSNQGNPKVAGSIIGKIESTGANTVNGAIAFETLNGAGPGGTERARIDSSGRLLVGTSSDFTNGTGTKVQTVDQAGGQLAIGRDTSTVNTGNLVGRIRWYSNVGGTSEETARITAEADGNYALGDKPGRLVFSVTADGASSPTERVRITSIGSLRCYTDTTGVWSATGAAAGTSIKAFVVSHSATGVASGTESLRIFSNGNVENTNNSYGAISDIKLKENIVDATSQWDDIKALRPVNYNFKEGQTHTQLGLIAQEVELVSPGLVSESPDRDEDENDLGTVTKSVNYSVLYMKAVKALQEAMERIETLEAKVAALEAS